MPKSQGPSGLPDDLRIAIAEFEDLQEEYADAGASDTEPDGVFHWIIKQGVHRKTIDWEKVDFEVFDTPPDDDDDAEDRRTYERALEAIPKLKYAGQKVHAHVILHADSRKVVDILRDYCWRTSF